jgi:short-subunit dehydrogenase
MIVITGASDGLGLRLAKLYQDAGKKVINLSRRESPYADRNFSVDLSVGSEVIRVAKEIASIEESLEAIVNCAGILSVQPLGKITRH